MNLWGNNSQYNEQAFSYMRWATCIKCGHKVLWQITSMEKPLTSESFSMVFACKFFEPHFTISNRTTGCLPNLGFYWPSVYMPKPPEVRSLFFLQQMLSHLSFYCIPLKFYLVYYVHLSNITFSSMLREFIFLIASRDSTLSFMQHFSTSFVSSTPL